MEVKVYKLDGSVARSVTLPASFAEPLRPDLIRKAVNAARANRRQPYGAHPRAGKKRVVESWGPGQGVSRVPRIHGGGRAGFMPGSVGGRRAHPPKAERILTEKINRKERAMALRSALAATAAGDAVQARGHALPDERTLPLVVVDELADLKETQELIKVLDQLGLEADLQRASEGRHIRPGVGKLRGRRLRKPRSLLIVAHETENIYRAARNLPGVEVCRVAELNVERLAPGGDPGRLLLLTESGLRALEGVVG